MARRQHRAPTPRPRARHARAAVARQRSMVTLLALATLGSSAALQLASLVSPRASVRLAEVASSRALAPPPPAIPLDDWGGALVQEVPLVTATTTVQAPGPALGSPASIPTLTLGDYERAAGLEATLDPGCHLQWPLLAAIGLVESNHGRHTQILAGRRVVLGPVLNGGAFAAVPDTDHGRLDGDPRWDRAVGPMQFLPSTWARYAVDANGDGTADPQDGADAAAGAAAYLCAAGGDVGSAPGLRQAIFSYNHSDAYVQQVLTFTLGYSGTNRSLAAVAKTALSH